MLLDQHNVACISIITPQRQEHPFIVEVTFNFLSVVGLIKLEAGISASVLKPQVEGPKVSIIKDVIKPPVSSAVKLMEKYKVRQREICSLSISLKFYIHMDYQLWLDRP